MRSQRRIGPPPRPLPGRRRKRARAPLSVLFEQRARVAGRGSREGVEANLFAWGAVPRPARVFL